MRVKPCLASQLVARLQSMIAEHGDLPVCLDDTDTGDRLAIGLVHVAADEDCPEQFEIKATYGWGEWAIPEGYIEPLSPREHLGPSGSFFLTDLT